MGSHDSNCDAQPVSRVSIKENNVKRSNAGLYKLPDVAAPIRSRIGVDALETEHIN